MIVLIGQLLLTLSLSVAGVWFIGIEIYAIVAIVSALVVAGCLLGVPGKRDLDDDEGINGFAWQDIGAALGFGALLGIQWPALPIIVAWGAAQRRAQADASRASARRVL